MTSREEKYGHYVTTLMDAYAKCRFRDQNDRYLNSWDERVADVAIDVLKDKAHPIWLKDTSAFLSFCWEL